VLDNQQRTIFQDLAETKNSLKDLSFGPGKAQIIKKAPHEWVLCNGAGELTLQMAFCEFFNQVRISGGKAIFFYPIS